VVSEPHTETEESDTHTWTSKYVYINAHTDTNGPLCAHILHAPAGVVRALRIFHPAQFLLADLFHCVSSGFPQEGVYSQITSSVSGDFLEPCGL